eukprot:Skav230649  [mRNA]  locus=scaffold2103:119892:124753:- [translate_table: standard]
MVVGFVQLVARPTATPVECSEWHAPGLAFWHQQRAKRHRTVGGTGVAIEKNLSPVEVATPSKTCASSGRYGSTSERGSAMPLGPKCLIVSVQVQFQVLLRQVGDPIGNGCLVMVALVALH